MEEFANAVSTAVISKFNSCPNNGKPKAVGGVPAEFTVLSAIVALRKAITDDMNEIIPDIIVISLATGTKCAGKSREDTNGYVTCDSHAEILARRGLVRWMTKWISAQQQHPQLDLDESCPFHAVVKKSVDGEPKVLYGMKENWSLYLYVSDSPCGDGNIYDRNYGNLPVDGFTGAKLIRPNAKTFPESLVQEQDRSSKNILDGAVGGNHQHGCCYWEREDIQKLGAVRTKSGRSDIQVQNRTTSMSCSDKICRSAAKRHPCSFSSNTSFT